MHVVILKKTEFITFAPSGFLCRWGQDLQIPPSLLPCMSGIYIQMSQRPRSQQTMCGGIEGAKHLGFMRIQDM